MKINLSNIEKEKFQKLKKTMYFNTLFLQILSSYLNYDSKIINKSLIDDFKKQVNLSNLESFYHLFYSFFIDELKISNEEKEVLNFYLCNSIKQLKNEKYSNNDYNLHINVNNNDERWKFITQHYQPFEGFPCGFTIVDELNYFIEFPQIGYFKHPFYYMSVLENNREWMTITPNEIETMKKHIVNASGNVLTFGLGLGYYAYMVSQKVDVKSVTIVERDLKIIDMFKKNILLLFPNKDKINIIHQDAFDYLKDNSLENIDYVFVDIWHDVQDGIFLYLQFKCIEDNYNVHFNYWIEEEIILLIRKIVIKIIDEQLSGIDIVNIEDGNKQINALYKRFYNALQNIEINSYYDIYKLISKDELQILSKYIYKQKEVL